MKLLKQPTNYSCGPTCVAMIANVTAEEAIAVLDKKRKSKSWAWRGTSAKELVRILGVLKIRCRRKLRKKTEKQTLPSLCIIKLCITGVRWGHWAVYNKGKVYDPYFGMNPTWPSDVHVTSYLEILQ